MTAPKRPHILIVEDEAITAMDLTMELRRLAYEVCATEDTAGGAIAAAERYHPDLVLMDIRLSDGDDGVDAARYIATRFDTAVVFLTAHSDDATLARALAVSPYGYIVKPFRARDLKVAVELALAKRAAEREARATVSELILTDALTGLANRRHFDQTLEAEWARAAREGHAMAVIMIDIDHFKAFNDTHGHAAGDACLQAVAGALRSQITRPGDLVCRWGGEEFVVILPGADVAGAERVANRLAEAVRELRTSHPMGGIGPHVTISAGVASAIPDGDLHSARAMVEQADIALYAAKHTGRDRVCCAPVR